MDERQRRRIEAALSVDDLASIGRDVATIFGGAVPFEAWPSVPWIRHRAELLAAKSYASRLYRARDFRSPSAALDFACRHLGLNPNAIARQIQRDRLRIDLEGADNLSEEPRKAG